MSVLVKHKLLVPRSTEPGAEDGQGHGIGKAKGEDALSKRELPGEQEQPQLTFWWPENAFDHPADEVEPFLVQVVGEVWPAVVAKRSQLRRWPIWVWAKDAFDLLLPRGWWLLQVWCLLLLLLLRLFFCRRLFSKHDAKELLTQLLRQELLQIQGPQVQVMLGLHRLLLLLLHRLLLPWVVFRVFRRPRPFRVDCFRIVWFWLVLCVCIWLLSFEKEVLGRVWMQVRLTFRPCGRGQVSPGCRRPSRRGHGGTYIHRLQAEGFFSFLGRNWIDVVTTIRSCLIEACANDNLCFSADEQLT